MRHPFQILHMNKVGVAKLENGSFILPIPSHGNDDDTSVGYHSFYDEHAFNFSPNIQVIAAMTTGFSGGGFVVVSKKDPTLFENVTVMNPDTLNEIHITF